MPIPKPQYRFGYEPGKIMKAARITAGLTVATVADAIGSTSAAVVQMEKGKDCPTAMQWYAFCQCVQISSDTFFHGYSRDEHILA